MINVYTFDICLNGPDKKFIDWYCEEFGRTENELIEDMVCHAISDFKYFSGYPVDDEEEDEENGEDD